jgi:hypothetical protein
MSHGFSTNQGNVAHPFTASKIDRDDALSKGIDRIRSQYDQNVQKLVSQLLQQEQHMDEHASLFKNIIRLNEQHKQYVEDQLSMFQNRRQVLVPLVLESNPHLNPYCRTATKVCGRTDITTGTTEANFERTSITN